MKGQRNSALEELGQGGKSAFLLLSTELIFHIFFLHSFFSHARSPFILKIS